MVPFLLVALGVLVGIGWLSTHLGRVVWVAALGPLAMLWATYRWERTSWRERIGRDAQQPEDTAR